MEVGTKILIKQTRFGCLGAEGKVGIVTNKSNDSGLHESKPGYNVELENGYVWRINLDAEVEILGNIFSRDLLRDGVIVKRKNDTYAIVIGNCLYSRSGHSRLTNYDKDLKNKECVNDSLDIVAFYKPIGSGDIDDLLDGVCLTLIAERSENVREMTLDEICKELGYNVKIIKEDK